MPPISAVLPFIYFPFHKTYLIFSFKKQKHMNTAEGILLFFAAAVAGAINSIAGGGSFVAFPALLFTGVPPINSNAICSVALWPGSMASVGGYRLELLEEKKVLPWMILISLIGGTIGSIIMLKTPQNTFMALVPWLLLIANILFIFGGKAINYFRGESSSSNKRNIILSVLLQLFISFYGGFFGAGMGILMLAALTIMGMTNIHKMNAFKTVLGSVINGIAAVIFIASGVIFWNQAGVMILGAILGGFGGAHYARQVDPAKVKKIVIAIGLFMTVYFFIKIYILK